MSTVYQIAGHDLQDWGKDPRESKTSFKDSTNNLNQSNALHPQTVFSQQNIQKSSLKRTTKYSQLDTELVKSQYEEDPTVTQQSKEGDENDLFYEPQDLGVEYFDYLQQKFKEKNQFSTSDPDTLYNYWKSLRRMRKNTKPKTFAPRITDDMSDSQMKRMAEILEKKQQEQIFEQEILRANPQDVEKTLKVHSQEEQKDQTMSKFFKTRAKEIELENQRKKQKESKQDKQKREESQQRLYQQKQKPPEYEVDRKKREKEEKQRQKQLEKNLEYQKQKQFENKRQERNDFINKLRAAHKQEKPEDKSYNTQEKLYDFYGGLSHEQREQYKLPENANEIKNDLDLYFEERAQDLLKVHKMKQGYDTDKVKDIIYVWKNKTTPLEKSKYFLDFEDEENVKQLLTNYFKNKENERKQEEEQLKKEQEEKEKKEQEKIEKAQKNVKKKSAKLATAKDRLKLGKQILILKQMFPNDKVLRKLLLKEFQDTRLAKFPEEYDIYDSDEENATKERIKHEKHISLKTIDKPQQEKEQTIKKLFEKMLKKYEQKKLNQIEDKTEQKLQQTQNDLKMERFMQQKAKEFIDQRNKRFDEFDIENEDEEDLEEKKEKVQTLKKFLSQTYKEMIGGVHKEATKRNFPHLKYGESEKLKKRSFPVTFKRHFFRIVKQYLRGQNGSVKDKSEKLPFWIPGGDGMRCRIHEKIDCPKNCKYITQNKKVLDLMASFQAQKKWEKQIFKFDKQIAEAKKKPKSEQRDKEIEWLEEQKQTKYLALAREQNSAWVDDKYLEERQQVMLTYSDAQNCTFQPDVRIPRKDENGERTFEKWVDAWGENFKKKQPRIFKLGVLKQCGQLISKGKYLDAYSKLRDTFNIEEIKEHFDVEAGREYKMISKRSMYIQGKDDPEEVKTKMPHENFENPNNIPILQDVDKMVRFLEGYEQNLRKARIQTQKMIEQDPFAPEDPLLTKSLMATSQMKDGDKSTMSTMTSTTYAQRRKQVKTFMCPLGDKCPRIMEGRWPQSDISSIVPLGAQCEFAHTYAELKFKKELKSKKNMLKNYVKLLEGKKDPQVKSWNPAGNKFEQCNGCGFRCRMCKERQANMNRIQSYAEVKEKNQNFLKSYEKELKKKEKEEEEKRKKELEDGGGKKGLGALKKFAKQMATKLEKDNEMKYKYLKKKEEISLQKIQEKKEQEQKYNKKISQLQKANTLYKQERYSEAFKIICNSVQIVKQELEEEQEKDKQEDIKWRKTLGLSEDQEITPEVVYQNLNKANDDPELEDQAHILYLYAQKRGIIGHKKPNVNQFLNIQIEESYLKIEKKLTDKEKDIVLMKMKIEKIEGEEDENNENNKEKNNTQGFDWRQDKRQQIHGRSVCEHVREGIKCPEFQQEKQELIWQHQDWEDVKTKKINHKCSKPHQPYEIYLEKGEQKINNLNRSIKKTENEIVKSTKPQPYKPSSAQTAIMDVNEWRDKQQERELSKPTNKQKKNKIDKSHRAEIWEKDIDELIMPVHERPKKQV